MLKIDASSPNGTDIVVVLSGWIRREHLAELERLLKGADLTNRLVSLDLADVSLVDREAVDFLASGAGRGARLQACPPYLREWLKSLGREAR
jgi:ABC-type transporter Mla MlaB component